MSTNQTDFSLLDSTLDDLADLPEFKPFPAGAHRATVEFAEKSINNKPAVELKLVAVSTEELADPAKDQPLNPGTETNCLFILTTNDGKPNEVAQGKLKEVLKALRNGGIDGATTRDLIQNAKGTEVLVVTKVRKGKDGANDATDIVSMEVC